MKNQKRTKLPRPDLWSFRDARAYATDFCAWKKAHSSGFSFRRISRLAELGSPNYFQAFLQGKRNLKADTAQRIATALGLSEGEQTGFVSLVAHTQSTDPVLRRETLEEFLTHAARYGRTGRIDRARLAYFANWYIPVVHSMASLKGFRADPYWICDHIVPTIAPAEASRALEALSDLGVLSVDARGQVQLNERRVETVPELRSLLIREYHRTMIGLANRSLDTWPPESRTTSAVTITVPSTLLPEVLKRVDDYRRDLFDWLVQQQHGQKAIDGEIMQINFQAFPVTDVQRTSQ